MTRLRVACVLSLAALAPLPAFAADESPRVRSIQPASVDRGVGSDVVVEGSYLFPVEDVTVDKADVSVSVAATGNSPTRLRLHVTPSDASTPGPLRLTIKTKNGTAVSERLSIRLRAPTVSKVVPSDLPRGRTFDLVVSGANLALRASETKTSVPPPMTVLRDPKSTDRQILAKVVVPPETPLGPHAITIETRDGKASAGFHVVASPPSVSSVEPASLARGSSAVLRIAGENLAGAVATLAVPDPGLTIAAEGPSVTEGLSLRVQAGPTAQPGSRTIVVATADGSDSARFDVVVDPPVLARVNPAGAARGTSTEVSVEGKGLPKNAEFRVVPTDPAVRVEAPSGGRPPRVASQADAPPGPRTLLVTTPQGAVLAPFQVTLHPPSLSGLAPAEAAPGSPVEVTVEGSGLEGAVWSVVPSDGTVAVEALGKGRLRVTVAEGARPGPRHVVVRNADGLSVALFSVPGSAPSAPVVSSIQPTRVGRRGPAQVVLRGVNLAGSGTPPTVTVEGPGGSKVDAKVAQATSSSLAVDLGVGPSTVLGAYLVTVSTADGGGAAVVEVTGEAPTIASVEPGRLARPFAGEVALAGTGLVGPDGAPPEVHVARADGGGPVAAKVVSATATALRVRLEIPAEIPPVDLLLTVATVDGGAAALLPVVPAPPSVASVAPRRIGMPATLEFRVEGENLLEPGGKPPRIAVTRAGSASALRAQVLDAKATAVRLRVTTPPGAVPGPHVLSFRTADGVAAAVFEVVAAPPPIVESIERDGTEAGTAILTRLRGKGLQGASAVTFDGEGVQATVLPGGTETEVPLRIVVEAGAKKGPRAFRVSAAGGDGASEKVVFHVR